MVGRYENVIKFLTIGMETKNENVQDLSYIFFFFFFFSNIFIDNHIK